MRLKFWVPTNEKLREMAEEFFKPGKEKIKARYRTNDEFLINWGRQLRLRRYIRRYPNAAVAAVLDVLERRFEQAELNNTNPQGKPFLSLLELLEQSTQFIPKGQMGRIARMLTWEEVVCAKDHYLSSNILIILACCGDSSLSSIVAEHLQLVEEYGSNLYESPSDKNFLNLVLTKIRSRS